jgi:DNA-binding transcriptional LysR family regulator
VRVREVDTHIGVEQLQRRELDIALLRQLSAPKGCERIALKREPFVLAVPAGLKTPKGIGRDLALGADLPWIWIPRALTPEYHDQVASCCRAAGFIPQAQHLAQSINSQLVMVASGLGVALVPEDSLRGHLADSIKTIRLQQTKTIDLAAVWRQSGNRLVADFLEVVLSRRGRGR